MAWDGKERRKEPGYCPAHIQLCEDMAVVKTTVLSLDKRINGSIDTIERHIQNGIKVWVAIGGLVFTIFLMIISASRVAGETKKQIEVNTVRLTVLEEIHPRK